MLTSDSGPGTGVSPTRARRGLEPVGPVVESVLKHAGLAEGVRRVAVLGEWAEAVGPRIAAVTRARSVTDRALVVEVRSSSWMMELQMLKAELLESLRRTGTSTRVERIHLVLTGDPDSWQDPDGRPLP